jgi:hypothetical protein
MQGAQKLDDKISRSILINLCLHDNIVPELNR